MHSSVYLKIPLQYGMQGRLFFFFIFFVGMRKIYVSIEKDVHVDNDSESSPEGEINSEWINCDRDKEESEGWEKSKSL